ncbi:hypothetical protein ASZ78_013490 [Callipepla squamata]|uniref:AP-4 complex accessory subunit Tepsin VHS/ENTH-like domain-containing protein n=1 Tax=Callipepla squamata TaxID=9009 RepID=A0A226MHA6_CALSU|nr:hypothetical protein ASZ78_013490 [Callipepla squamata]
MAVPLRDRLCFLSRLPVLLRGTADEEGPCPGFVLEEISSSSQCLLEFLLGRLRSGSCHVKLKVLKILQHTCAQGSPQFLLQLRRNAAFIREAAAFTGPPDPLHGNSLNQKVRAAAQDLTSVLFSDAVLPTAAALPARPLPPAGMGSKSSPCSSMQGFGFSSERGGPVSHQPGLAGGGWEEADSGHSSQNSSQENGDLSRTSDTYSKSGSDSHSGASRELVSGAERVDADSLGDCLREVSLVSALTQGARVFLTREEAQHFLKECGLLNCEVVLELLSRALEDPSDSVRMRSMSAISSLMCSDLLALDQIFAGTRQHLQQLSQGSPGPVANRATKILRQFEALCRGRPSPKTSHPRSAPSALTEGSAPCTGDLLTDIPPLPCESILQPLSAPTLPSTTPADGAEPGLEAEPWEQPSPTAVPDPHGQEAASRLVGDVSATAVPSRSLSLFAGMELVALPGTALAPRSPPTEPQTLPQPQDDAVPDQSDAEPSAFSFLNA